MTASSRYCPYQWVARRNARCHHCGRLMRQDIDLVARAYPNCCQAHAWKATKWTNHNVGAGNFICTGCVQALNLEVVRHEHPEDTGTQEALSW